MQARASSSSAMPLLQPQHTSPRPPPPHAASTSARSARPTPPTPTPTRPTRALAVAAPPRARSFAPRRRPLAAAAAAASETSDSTTTDCTSPPSSIKVPWYTKNAEGWTAVASATDLARAASAARRAGKRVLALDLFAPWCSSCRSSWPALSRLARDPALAAEVAFCKASIEDDDIRRLIKEQGVTGIPFVLVLDVGEAGGTGGVPEPPSEAAETIGLLSQMFGQFLAKRGFGGGKKQEESEGAAAAAAAATAAAAAGAAAVAAPVVAAAAGAVEGAEGSTAPPPPPRVLDAAGATLLLGQGAAFKRIAVLKTNLAAVPALARGGRLPVVVDPNGLVVVADDAPNAAAVSG